MSSRRTVSRRILAAVVGLAAFGSVVVPARRPALAQDESAADAGLASFVEGVSSYRAGKDEEGLKRLKEILASDPSQGEALAMREAAGYDFWARLLAKGGDHEITAKEFLRRARVESKARRNDPQAIRKLVDDLASDDFKVRQAAAYRLGSEHGAFAVPHFKPVLANPRAGDHLVNSIHALSNMGLTVVTPLVQLLSSKDEFLLQNLAVVLGNIGDSRAVPGLKRSLEANPGPALRTTLESALARCGGASGRSAAGDFVALGSAYYRLDPYALRESAGSGVFWKWDAAAATAVPVEAPPALVPYLMAEDAAANALALDPASGEASTLLVRALVAQALVTHAGSAGGGEEGGASGDELAQAAGRWAAPVLAIAKSAGCRTLYAAQQAAIADGDTDVANAISMALGAVEKPSEFPGDSSLTEALKNSDLSVRASAALAVAAIDPQGEFTNKDQVVPALLDAASETIRRQLLVIDDVETSRNEVVKALRDRNYFVTWAESGLRGLERAMTSPVIDLVVIRSNLSGGMTTDQVLAGLARDHRTEKTPRVILSPEGRSTDDQNYFGQKAAGYVSLPLVPEEFLPAVESVLGSDENPHRKWAMDLATAAAERLANLAAPGSGYAFPPNAAEALLRALVHPDPVKVPAIVALGRLGNGAALDALVAIAADSASSSPAARGAAARSVGEIGAATGSLPTAAVDVLTSALGDADATVRDGAAAGLAVAPLSDAQRQAVYAARRLDPAGIAGGGGGPDSGGAIEVEESDDTVDDESFDDG